MNKQRKDEQRNNKQAKDEQPKTMNGDEKPTNSQNDFPIVAVGASAGGLKAFEHFFQALPSESEMAFVVIQHLAPNHESELAQLLQNHTHMKVMQVEDQTLVQPNHVYVIPPGKRLSIDERVLLLSEPKQPRGHRAPIDYFFRVLAEDQGENSVCIILSGTGTDGTLGLKAIKERGGITMAQTIQDAEYDGMPRSAVATGLVDVMGTAEELAKKLVNYKDNAAKIRLPEEPESLPENESEALSKIFTQLANKTGHDFTHYKRTTILRRIARRLQVNEIENIPNYLKFIRTNTDEVQSLFRDFLISVTNFFRDPEAFAVLEEKIIPDIFDGKGNDDQVRVWVAGCATGEEAYSIAILLREYADQLDNPPDIQIFASDIDDDAIGFAREGLYNDTIAVDLAPERLQRFFVEESGGYRVKKELRETILFTVHNLIKDPPFSRLDLISCRNLLIYLNRDIQEKIFELFHYATRSQGFLFLGLSEAAETVQNLFVNQNKKHRIFRRRDAVESTLRYPVTPLLSLDGTQAASLKIKQANKKSLTLEEMYGRWSLANHTPARILVDDNYNIVHIYSGAGKYLHMSDGPLTQGILQQVDPTVRLGLRTALYQAFQKKEPTSYLSPLFVNDNTARLVINVNPILHEEFTDSYVEVIFKESLISSEAEEVDSQNSHNQNLLAQRLEEELQRSQAQLQTSVEEYETANEELKASNEELQSMNEELQSTTEELETSKEELQSMNEELITVNQELKNKIEELSNINSEQQNFIAATDVATIFLNKDFSVKRFTPRAQDICNIIPSDNGRPFEHISHRLIYDDLHGDVADVLRNLSTIEREVESKEGCWFIVRMFPFRTFDDKIDGVVITFVDVTELKATQQSFRSSEIEVKNTLAQLETIYETAPIGMAFLDTELRYQRVNQMLADINGVPIEPHIGKTIHEVLPMAIADSVEPLMMKVVEQGENVSDLEVEGCFPTEPDTMRHWLTSYYPVRDADDEIIGINAVVLEITKRKEIESKLQQSEVHLRQQKAELEAIFQNTSVGLSIVDTDQRIIKLNRRMVEINGMAADAQIKKIGHELFPELSETVRPNIQRVIDTKEPLFDVEFKSCVSKGGESLFWRVSWIPIKDNSDEVIFVLSVVQDVTQRRKQQMKLLQLAEELEDRVIERTQQVVQLSTALTMAEQWERRRISQVLHDHLQQMLYGLQMRVTMLEQKLEADAQAEHFEEMQKEIGKQFPLIQELIVDAIQSTRSLSVELSPPILESDGLLEALKWLASHMKKEFTLSVDIDAKGEITEPSKSVSLLLIQLVRELLFNIVKHAETERALVFLHQDEKHLVLRVKDEGVGFDMSEFYKYENHGTGFGLFSISERLRYIGGNLDINSEQEQGTQMTITIPLEI